MQVQFVSGGRLGSVEESFIARLRKGDVFMFAGRLLELVRTQQMTAYVRIAPKGSAALPRWSGGRMPLSNTLADAMLEQLAQAEHGEFSTPEMRCAQPLLELQTDDEARIPRALEALRDAIGVDTDDEPLPLILDRLPARPG